MPQRGRSLWWSASLIFLSLAGCGEPLPDSAVSTKSALTGPRSYLVSFTGADIPANADALVKAADGQIAARYPNIGAVLARSASASFAPTLRLSTGIAAVGAVTAASTKLTPMKPIGHRPTLKTPPHASGGDPLSFRQWDMEQIHAPQAHGITAGSKSVLVGFVDSGVDITHPDLVGQVNAAASASCVGGVPDTSPSTWAHDVIGHGTITSSIVAAKKNGIGMVGVAPGVQVAMVKVLIDDFSDPNAGLVFPDAFVCGIEWGIAHGFALLNASLSIDPFTGPVDDIFCSDDPDRAAVIQIVRQAIHVAAKHDLTVVAASNNNFTDLANLPGSGPGVRCSMLPVQSPKVIGVSAVGYTRLLSFYSNYGAGAVDVTAPGGDSLIPDPLVTDTLASGQVVGAVPVDSGYYAAALDYDGQLQDCSSGTCAYYAYVQGTSFATPHVTGVAALVISKAGNMKPDALAARLRATATPLPCPPNPYDPDPADFPTPATCKGPPQHNNFYGAGEVDALAALR
jgi:subtilisin family serine protease